MKREVIGEGGYGCVHKPSIHCKTSPKPGFDYKSYVSKIMKTSNAKRELSEFVIIGKIDPTNEYHLGKPILCKPNLDETDVKNDIKKCKHIKLENIEEKPEKYSLLLLKYGGVDLKALCGEHLQKYLKKDKTVKTDNFWLEVHHLIKGLKFFKDNGIIHNDIKPQNILFNSATGKMKYIDFGLMRTKKEVIKSSKNNENYLGMYHWSYPFDCGFMNDEKYQEYQESKNKERYKNTLSELIVADSEKNPLNLSINKPSSFKILFTYLNPENTIPNPSTQYGYINAFFDGFNKMINEHDYNYVLNHTTDSIDVFGLGFTLQYMANCFKRLNALSLEDFTRLSTFFHKMYDFNSSTKVIDIDILLDEYENILLELGVLTRLKKSFEKNNVVNKLPAPPVIMEVSKIDEKSPSKYLSLKLQEFADKDPILISEKCSNEKEFNPKTRKCVKKSKKGGGHKKNKNFKYNVTRKTNKYKLKPKSKSLKNKKLKFRNNRF